VLFVVGLLGLVFTATQPVVDAGDSFMSALRDGNYNNAYNMCAPSVQQEVTDAQGMEDEFGAYQPANWTFTSRSIRNDLGRLEGTVNYKEGNSGTVRLEFVKSGDDWKVSGASLK
jgi:hypothetical protein